jgi:hypothetical protein
MTVFPIHPVNRLDMAFGGDVSKLLPPYADIPAPFKSDNTRTWFHKLPIDWFYRGLTSIQLTPRDGVDGEAALQHIRAVLVSFEPKHEHKMAGVAYLLDQWFSGGKWEVRK